MIWFVVKEGEGSFKSPLRSLTKNSGLENGSGKNNKKEGSFGYRLYK